MQITAAKTDICGSVPLGAGLWPSHFLSREERSALEGAVASSRAVNAHKDLVSEREPAESLFLIKEGWACRYMMTREGGRQFIALLVQGDLCNLDTLLFDRLDYSVRTLTQATIVALPRDRAVALARKHPGITRMFAWRALVENATLGKLALTLGRLSAMQRLAHLLCELRVRLGVKHDDESSFEFPLTQEQIADALGLTAVHVNRMMQVLRTDGLVSLANRIMTIQNVERLSRIGDFDPHYLHIGEGGVASVEQVSSSRLSLSQEAPPSGLGA